MAKVKSSAPTLRKTKAVSTSAPRTYTPRAPRSPYDYPPKNLGSMGNIVATANRYPYETLGYLAGTLAANYADRGQQKFQNEQAGILTDNILSKMNHSESPQSLIEKTYGGMDMNQSANDYLASDRAIAAPTGSDTLSKAANAANDARQAGMQMMMNGQPMTAAAVNAMGLSPTDQAKQKVVDSRIADYIQNGPNASQAKRQQQRLYEKLDGASAYDLSLASQSDLEKFVDAELANTKMSWTNKKAVRADVLRRLQQQANEQAYQKAVQLYREGLMKDPNSEEGKQHERMRAEYGTQLLASGKQQLGELLMGDLLKRKANEGAFFDWKRKKDYESQLGLSDYEQKKIMDIKYPKPTAKGTKKSSEDLYKQIEDLKKQRFGYMKQLSTLEANAMKNPQFDANGKLVNTYGDNQKAYVDELKKEIDTIDNMLLYLQNPEAYKNKKKDAEQNQIYHNDAAFYLDDPTTETYLP